MKRTGPIVLFLLTLAAALAPVAAQQGSNVTFGGQVRPRFESREPVDGSWDSFTSMRVRANISAALERGIRVFIQLQDVRLWGEETNTVGDFRADNFDLHQGYIEAGELPFIEGTLRVGRQEMALGEHRLIGTVNWSQQGRAFDGIRLSTSVAGHKLDLFGMTLADNTAATHAEDANLIGAYYTVSTPRIGDLDLYWIYDETTGGVGTQQSTVGARWVESFGEIDVRLEGSYQFGERTGADVSAYMLGGRAGIQVREGARLTVLYDYLSGDSDPAAGDVEVFSTLFATNHAFYGTADIFTDIPAHTGGRGLQDAAVRFDYDLRGGLAARADIHTFRAAEQGSLSTAHFGEELDLSLTYRHSRSLTVMGGYSFVRAADGLQELGRLTQDSQWTFLMANVSF